MPRTVRLALMLSSLALALCACSKGEEEGGGSSGGGTTPPATLFSDDFSSGTLSNWSFTGTVANSGTGGNPPPAMRFGSSVGGAGTSASVSDFSFTGGLTLSFDMQTVSRPGLYSYFGGINNGTAAASGRGAGFLLHQSIIDIYLNGAVVTTYPSPGPSLANYKVKILPTGFVQYLINNAVIYTSTTPVSFTSPRGALFINGTANFAEFNIDNVVVTVP